MHFCKEKRNHNHRVAFSESWRCRQTQWLYTTWAKLALRAFCQADCMQTSSWAFWQKINAVFWEMTHIAFSQTEPSGRKSPLREIFIVKCQILQQHSVARVFFHQGLYPPFIGLVVLFSFQAHLSSFDTTNTLVLNSHMLHMAGCIMFKGHTIDLAWTSYFLAVWRNYISCLCQTWYVL